jgi:histidine triad (HIT) family protein
MATCDICKILENKDMFKFIYEDDTCFAILHENPSIAGHSLVIPKKHVAILEDLDDSIVEHLYVIANKVSTSIFDAIGAHGTNIILNNGHGAGQELPHVILNVLPRKENDNINIEWQAKKAPDNELKTVQSMLRTYAEHIFSGKDRPIELKPKEEKHDAHKEKVSTSAEKKEEDYLIKGLRRIP